MVLKVLKFLFSNVGLTFCCVGFGVLSWFTLPAFIILLTYGFSVLNWQTCSYALFGIGTYLYSSFSAIWLIVKNIIDKKWLLIVVGVIVILNNVAIAIYYFVV